VRRKGYEWWVYIYHHEYWSRGKDVDHRLGVSTESPACSQALFSEPIIQQSHRERPGDWRLHRVLQIAPG
jgi:hypothetical protein